MIFLFIVDPYSEATIWEIKDDNFGLIEIKGRRKVKKVFSEDEFQDYRFFVLFHKDQVKTESQQGFCLQDVRVEIHQLKSTLSGESQLRRAFLVK
jgi:hypothetical protein